ncbi:hypothetical protein HXX76_006665 [Chlamydomonas incerta]|uniref:AB hydrolase-1 domain-containing protein n=1 Tax=Chlamydomonas incerta TaxID=51695 RepID=A0A835T023_CHLIN|nr:hypothetical protein HXX76_006665 [Chlamydomonas incerta]|eukprot:KAG2436358.1 hypothetical protein HXX76_006665 [Chlamydomonas incerta]
MLVMPAPAAEASDTPPPLRWSSISGDVDLLGGCGGGGGGISSSSSSQQASGCSRRATLGALLLALPPRVLAAGLSAAAASLPQHRVAVPAQPPAVGGGALSRWQLVRTWSVPTPVAVRALEPAATAPPVLAAAAGASAAAPAAPAAVAAASAATPPAEAYCPPVHTGDAAAPAVPAAYVAWPQQPAPLLSEIEPAPTPALEPLALAMVAEACLLPQLPQLPQLPSQPYGDSFTSTTVLQTAPADPALSASQLPAGYSRRATLLLLRMVAAAVAFVAAAAGLAAAALWLVGWGQLLVLLAAAEVAFAVHYRRKYAVLNAQPARHAPEHHDPLAAFHRLLQVCQYFSAKIDARVYLSTWFCGADYRLIRRDNVADLIAYGFWYKSRSEMEAAGLGPLLRQCVSGLERAFRISLPPGHQPGLRCMYHLWEPLRTIYRPLAFYAATEALALLTQALLLAMGCRLSRQSTAPAGARAGQGLGMLVATAGLARPAAAAAANVAGTARKVAGASSKCSGDPTAGTAAATAAAAAAYAASTGCCWGQEPTVLASWASDRSTASLASPMPRFTGGTSSSSAGGSSSSSSDAGSGSEGGSGNGHEPPGRAHHHPTAAVATAYKAGEASVGRARGASAAASAADGEGGAGSGGAAGQWRMWRLRWSAALLGLWRRVMRQATGAGAGAAAAADAAAAAAAAGAEGGAASPPLTPVLLLHGVGLGLLPYTNFIRCLLAAGLPLVALEYKHVSMRLCSVIPSADDIALAAAALLSRLGVPEACVVAHSYGTFVASRLAQLQPDRLLSLALLDPVCFGMFMPHLLANFIYREPRTSSLSVWAKDMLFNFVSRDLHCAAALCRRFYWSDVNLWPQDIPGRTLVAIGGHDQLIHVDEVLDFIQHYAAKILYHHKHAHAELLMDAAWQQQIIADIFQMASAGGGAAGAREVGRRLTAMPAAAVRRTPTLSAAVLAPRAVPAAAAAAAAAADAAAPGEEVGPEGLAGLAAVPGVVRRVTTRSFRLAHQPTQPSLQQTAPQQTAPQQSPHAAVRAQQTAAAGWVLDEQQPQPQPEQEAAEQPQQAQEAVCAAESEEDVAALAAALSAQIGAARSRTRPNAATAETPAGAASSGPSTAPAPVGLLAPAACPAVAPAAPAAVAAAGVGRRESLGAVMRKESNGRSIWASAGAAAARPVPGLAAAGGGPGAAGPTERTLSLGWPVPHQLLPGSAEAAAAAAAAAATIGTAPAVACFVGAGAARPPAAVGRRLTASAVSGSHPEGLLLLELAGAGLNRAMLIQQQQQRQPLEQLARWQEQLWSPANACAPPPPASSGATPAATAADSWAVADAAATEKATAAPPGPEAGGAAVPAASAAACEASTTAAAAAPAADPPVHHQHIYLHLHRHVHAHTHQHQHRHRHLHPAATPHGSAAAAAPAPPSPAGQPHHQQPPSPLRFLQCCPPLPCIAEDGGAPPAAAAAAASAAACEDAQGGRVVDGVSAARADGPDDRSQQPTDKRGSSPSGSSPSGSSGSSTASPPISPPATPSDASGPATPTFLRPSLSCHCHHLLPGGCGWGGGMALSTSAPAGGCGPASHRAGGAWAEAAAARAHRLRRTVSS